MLAPFCHFSPDPGQRPRGLPPPQAPAQRRDASGDDADALFGEARGANSPAPVSLAALFWSVGAAARHRGPRVPPARAFAAPTKARAKKKKRTTRTRKPDDVSRFVSTGEGTSAERARASAPAAPRGSRTSLGDGIVKPAGSRMEWAELLRRIYRVDVLRCPWGGRRAIVADISEPTVIVAILAHLGWPPSAPPIARARRPAFEGA